MRISTGTTVRLACSLAMAAAGGRGHAKAATPEICVFVGESSAVDKCGSACFDHTHTFSATIKDERLEWTGRMRRECPRCWYRTNGSGCCPVTCAELERGNNLPCKVRTLYGDEPVTLPPAVLQEYRRVYCTPCDDCEAMLTPKPEAAKRFQALYAGLADPDVALTPTEKLALSRFLGNCEGARLLEDLSNLPCPEDWGAMPPCTMDRHLRFKLKFQNRRPGRDTEAGSVSPGDPYPNPDTSDPELLRQFVYTVSVTRQADSPSGSRHAFPAPNDACFSYTFAEGASEMAKTIYHELLHIWWMNKFQSDYNNSGHGTDLERCDNYEPEFIRRLREFYRVMDGLEKCLQAPPNS